MSRRFQIEDLLEQDRHGVTFEALDRESGQTVVLRRYFPFGPDGGGLSATQRADYEALLSQLVDLKHAGMRSLIGGGCDPQDGMPYLVSEQVTGLALAEAMRHGPIPAASALALLDRALEVSALVSEKLELEAIWVETDPGAIVVSQDDPERGFTFWISPLNWLHEADTHPGLSPVQELLRAVTTTVAPGDDPQLVGNLRRWQTWLAGNPSATSTSARRMLNQMVIAPVHSGATPPRPAAPAPAKLSPVSNKPATPMSKPTPVPGKSPVSPQSAAARTASPARPPGPPPKKKANPLLIVLLVLVLAACIAAVVLKFLVRQVSLNPPPSEEQLQREESQRAIDRVIRGESK